MFNFFTTTKPSTTTTDPLNNTTNYSYNELKETLEELNTHLTTVPIPRITTECVTQFENHVHMDSDLCDAILNKLNQTTSILEGNILCAVLSVYEQMNKNRQSFKLIYHQPRYAAEIFEDLALLLSTTNSIHSQMHLLILLCGLFSNSVFEPSPIEDKTKSAEALLEFLEPILRQMPIERANIIKKLIYTFTLATIPSVLNELSYFQTMLADVAIERTSIIPILEAKREKNDPQYNSEHWDLILEKCYPEFLSEYEKFDPLLLKTSLQRKLTEELRIIYEEIQSTDNSLNPLGEYVITLQEYGYSNYYKKNFRLNEEQILLFAQKFQAKSMNRTRPAQSNRNYDLLDTYPLHAKFLENIYNYLINSNYSIEEKNKLIFALTEVSENQDGKLLSLKKIQDISEQLENQIHYLQNRNENKGPT